MASKRALVVDDSKSARIALRDILERYGMSVDFAKSGEEALEFLRFQLVDVIFMDHSMPGMDGLEAVAEIKSNPRTATIPVMMYTAKEGEVYVSQARALGAVGVIPKEVHPGALFNMLLELGLVEERRVQPPETTEPAVVEPAQTVEPVAEPPAPADERRRELERTEESLRAVVANVLENQHVALRAAVLRSQRNFAHQVAEEVLARQRQESSDTDAVAAPDEPEAVENSRALPTVWIVVLLMPAVLLGVLYMNAVRDRDSAIEALSQLDTEASEQLNMAESVTTDLLKDMNSERRAMLMRQVETLEWALNEGGQAPFDEPAFNGRLAQTLEQLVERLSALGFRGTVRLTSHLGEFCLATAESGELTLADPASSVDDCSVIGHPLDDGGGERQTIEFANFLDGSRALDGSGVRVDVQANDRFSSVRRYSFPSAISTAGEWNRIAALNNRIEFALIPDEQ